VRDWWLYLAAFVCLIVGAVESWHGKPIGGRTPWLLLGLALFVLVFLLDAWPT
jgi:uncharacterized membrane protein YhiD involved in acid resistance